MQQQLPSRTRMGAVVAITGCALLVDLSLVDGVAGVDELAVGSDALDGDGVWAELIYQEFLIKD